MPRMQVFLGPVNAAFARDRINEIDSELFRPGEQRSLVDSLGEVLDLDDAIAGYLRRWPSGLLASVQGLLWDNLRRTDPLPVTFAWAPDYDYQVQIWDVADAKDTHGGITVLFRSRYPDDRHPNLEAAT